ncbi:hypothetical protein PMIN06_007993 [Paraphaeosphaeria minitans]|uniref:Nicotinamide N-methyltransferase n=1 Tax=Paraphaeosphaeria minitans TaxID=565426 RepID=A0A9P6KXD8_9PLEO|nr:nicotinamide N-methyltransferase [Paraphaeosphaeria minitans]
MLLPFLVTLRHPTSHELTPEDIFESSLGGAFVNDIQNQHGDDATTTILYRPSNPAYAQFALHPADVTGEEQRRKFAHYLWNAGIMMAELVGGRPAGHKKHHVDELWGEQSQWRDGEWWTGEEEEAKWRVKGETVLELGAGVGLGGIMSAVTGAAEVAITDYPAPTILETLRKNAETNIPVEQRANTTVHGHQWNVLDDDFSTSHAHHYTRILAADCLWMPHEHENLANSMLHFLSDSPDARVYVIAGFHTGRAKVAPFFEETVPAVGLEIEEMYEMDAEGKRRAWAAERDGGREDVSERKKWCVLARLRRRR